MASAETRIVIEFGRCRGTDQHGKHLCLASRLDAVVARLDTQAKMDTITKSMTNIVKSLESSLATDKMCLIVMLVLSVDLMQQVADDYVSVVVELTSFLCWCQILDQRKVRLLSFDTGKLTANDPKKGKKIHTRVHRKSHIRQ
ncbi:hypothetical protein YC2023_077056 [Brassica napus]